MGRYSRTAHVRVSPRSVRTPRIKAVKKSRKHYLFDWTTVEDPGARFENLVGFHLLKECHYQEDVDGHDAELRFFCDIEGREVDFVQMKSGKPVRFVECKVAGTAVSPALLYLRRKFPTVEALQVLARAESIASDGKACGSRARIGFSPRCTRPT